MAKLLAVASGKGGVGKTTVAINLGLALNNFGRRVIVVDGDLLKPNIATQLGLVYKQVKDFTLHKALKEKLQLDEIVYVHPSGLKCILGDIAYNQDDYNIEITKDVFSGIKSSELVIIDTPPGFSKLNEKLLEIADAVIIVVTPDSISVHDGLKTARFCERHKTHVLGVIVNRHRQGAELSKEDIEKIMLKPVLAVIPEDKAVLEAQKQGHPVIHYDFEANSTACFKELAAKLLGEKYVEIEEQKEASKFGKLLQKIGLWRNPH